MDWKKLTLSMGLVLAVLLAGARSADAGLINNGDPVGPRYTIQSIDAGVMVDFVATAPADGNSNTIGKLTVTMSHSNLLPLGFRLTGNAAATATSSASGGLRLLLSLKDTNAMTVAWTDYHIHAEDNAEDVNAIRQTIMPNEGFHRIDAHFHNTPDGFGSSPLVLQGIGDNVTDLNYVLGSPVDPGKDFTASNILLHEREFIGFKRDFQVTFNPTVPEPATFALAALGIFAVMGGFRCCLKGARRYFRADLIRAWMRAASPFRFTARNNTA